MRQAQSSVAVGLSSCHPVQARCVGSIKRQWEKVFQATCWGFPSSWNEVIPHVERFLPTRLAKSDSNLNIPLLPSASLLSAISSIYLLVTPSFHDRVRSSARSVVLLHDSGMIVVVVATRLVGGALVISFPEVDNLGALACQLEKGKETSPGRRVSESVRIDSSLAFLPSSSCSSHPVSLLLGVCDKKEGFRARSVLGSLAVRVVR